MTDELRGTILPGGLRVLGREAGAWWGVPCDGYGKVTSETRVRLDAFAGRLDASAAAVLAGLGRKAG